MTLTKHREKKLDGYYTRMLRAVLNKSLKQLLSKQQLFGHLLTILQTVKVRHAGHCWRNKDELISNVLLWTPTDGHTSVGWPAKIYIHQLCVDTACCLDELAS